MGEGGEGQGRRLDPSEKFPPKPRSEDAGTLLRTGFSVRKGGWLQLQLIYF